MASKFVVVDQNGMRGTVESAHWPAGASDQVQVRWEDGEETLIDASSLVAQPDGTYALGHGANLSAANVPTGPAPERATDPASVVVPVMEESLDVGKRAVETGAGVRVRKVVHQHEELIDQPLLMQEVDVKRVPVGKVVEGPVAIRHVGDTMIVPVLEERLVIQKQLILKEEIHITKRELSSRQPQSVIVRDEEALVERFTADGKVTEEAVTSPVTEPVSPKPFGVKPEGAPSIFDSFHDGRNKAKTEQRRISWTRNQSEPERKP